MSEIRTGCNDNCPYYYKNTGCVKPEGMYCPPQSITIYELSADTDKCNGCIYYNTMYLMCTKPHLVLCPKEERPNSVICPREREYIVKKEQPISSRKCIICEGNTMDTVCDECKEAIKKLKELLNNTTTTSASTSDEPLIVELNTPDEFIIYNEKGE